MAIRAYVLVRFEADSSKQVINDLRQSKGVISADLVTGPYDAIVLIEATDINEIAELVINKINKIPEAASSMTCLAIQSHT
ncbi:Lrp/AsnC ligand binding domain-containing protein [Chloroflexota bacterium]